MKIQASNFFIIVLLFQITVAQQILQNTSPPGLEISPRDADIKPDSTRADDRLPGSGRPDVGTKDAPVDGMDGKPHAGPWVDGASDTEKKKGSTTEKSSPDREKIVVEDSVMNDPNRKSPKKGTTGTEGGVSEKTKDQKAKDEEMGRQKPKKPEPPKDASSVSHGEESEKKKSGEKSEKQSGSGNINPDKSEDKEKDRPKGAPGIEVSSTTAGVQYARWCCC